MFDDVIKLIRSISIRFPNRKMVNQNVVSSVNQVAKSKSNKPLNIRTNYLSSPMSIFRKKVDSIEIEHINVIFKILI
ncbi:hypothetical protein A3Q56_00673 [Intoshia linei]|uniref:Uncharacterized protein n=1 Tax=Intoshia linei TaxID=1819745 RepID=A0A177BCU2_9BILA|nr:hypothetical protein A3Q56_00673 [Intoshia linei]